MKESPFGFQYTWEDIQPVRPLVITLVLTQIAGAAICLLTSPLPDAFNNIWLGGALGTFPGYILGLLIQKRIRPKSIGKNKVLVNRLGYIAFALTTAAIIIPKVGLMHAL